MFIAKLDLDGKVIWLKNPTTETNLEASDIHLAKDGSVYLTGFFTTTAYFESNTIKAADNGHGDIYVLKLKSNGTTAWVKAFIKDAALPINNSGSSVTTDDALNVYIIGHFGGRIKFDDVTVAGVKTEESRYDIFFAKLNPDGKTVFAKRIGSDFGDHGKDIFLYQNRVVLCGAINFTPFFPYMIQMEIFSIRMSWTQKEFLCRSPLPMRGVLFIFQVFCRPLTRALQTKVSMVFWLAFIALRQGAIRPGLKLI